MKANEVSNWHFINVPNRNKRNNGVTVSGDVGFVAAIVELAINARVENLGIMNNLFQGGATFGSSILNRAIIFVIPRSSEIQKAGDGVANYPKVGAESFFICMSLWIS